MRKIPTMFVRDPLNRSLVTSEVTPGCEWVAEGEGVPYAKWDGTAVEILAGAPWKRYELRPGKTAPAGFRPMQDVDLVTGKQAGWVPAPDGYPANRWLWEALGSYPGGAPGDGTYELCGPKVPPSRNTPQNPHGFTRHVLVPHGCGILPGFPRTIEGIREALVSGARFGFNISGVPPVLQPFGSTFNFEGVVFHHFDGRRAKIKRVDLGLPWPPPEAE